MRKLTLSRMLRWIYTHSVHFVSLGLIASAAFYSELAPLTVHPVLDNAVGSKVILEGLVIGDPDVRQTVQILLVQTPHGRVQVSTEPYRVRVKYGDTVRVTGKLKKPESFETSTGHTFDYPRYLLVHGVQHTMSSAVVEVVGTGGGSQTLSTLFEIKHWFIRGIYGAFPRDEAALLAGVLVGEKRGFSPELTEAFRRAGLVHIVVLSGYNIALVIRFIRAGADRFLSKYFSIATAALAALLFMLATGASETAVRATLMALVVLLAQALNRPAQALRILLIVAAGMAVFNPYLVLNDLSYQLSVLATLGLIIFSKPIESRLAFIPDRFKLREIVATTIAVELTVLPLLIYSIGQVSLVSVFSNVLVLPLIPWVMLGGFVAALGAHVSTILFFPITYLTYLGLHYVIVIAATLSALPFASLML